MIIRTGPLQWRVVATCVILSLLFVLSQVPAVAEGGGDGCNPGRSSNYLTWYWSGNDDTNYPSSYGGIYGNIFEYSPYVYDSSNSADGEDYTSQWIMLDNGNDWAQVGWFEYPGNERYTWVEFNDPGHSSWDNWFPSYSINSTIKFQITYQPTCPSDTCFSFFANNTSPQLTGSKYNWTPTDAQSNAETHDQASQIPGGYDDLPNSGASNLHVYYPAGSSGSWYTMSGETATSWSGGSGSAPSWVNVSDPGTTQTWYYDWDSACPH